MDFPELRKAIDAVQKTRNGPRACPWMKKQTSQSLLRHFIEEIHEFQATLDDKGEVTAQSADEVSDLLYQILLHAELLQEKGLSNLEDVARRLDHKIRSRNTHVFDPQHPGFSSAEAVALAWEENKIRKIQGNLAKGTPGVLSGYLVDVPASLPALARASRIGEKSTGVGFDWDSAEQVLDKVREEYGEFLAEDPASPAHREELGDLLFSLAQYARKKGWNPEEVLQQANQKFLTRFAQMEQWVQEQGKDFFSP